MLLRHVRERDEKSVKTCVLINKLERYPMSLA